MGRVLTIAKSTTLAFCPWTEAPGRAIVRHWRRLRRRPHEGSYSEIVKLSGEGVYLDVGANHGQSIESIRLFKPDARIVSFEILPHLALELRSRYPDVTVHACGLGEKDETVTVYVPRWRGYRLDALSSIRRAQAQESMDRALLLGKGVLEEYTCELRTLDSFNCNPSLIKIDVEGAERGVILGAMETIRRSRPAMLIEQGRRVIDLLTSMGYSHKEVDGDMWFFPG